MGRTAQPFITVFMLALGNADLGDYTTAGSLAVFAGFTLLGVVLMLNLLIASKSTRQSIN